MEKQKFWVGVMFILRWGHYLLVKQSQDPGQYFLLDVAFSHLFGNSSNIYLILGSVQVMDERDKVSIASNPLI